MVFICVIFDTLTGRYRQSLVIVDEGFNSLRNDPANAVFQEEKKISQADDQILRLTRPGILFSCPFRDCINCIRKSGLSKTAKTSFE